MPFNTNNNFNNNSNNNGGDKKKTNFRLGKVWGSDGQLDVSIWVADTGVRAILSIKAAVGKDPSTGANVLEQKMPNELPRFFMNIDLLRAFIDVVDATPDLGSINIVLDKGNAGKLTIAGQGSSIKITIDSAKQGSRTITFDSIGVGNKNIHAAFRNLCEYMKIAYRKALTNKLDPEEFGMAVNGGDNDDDLPI
jgi:hypothetical protein